MNKRSYLDTLNEGRQRKPSTTLEQITQSLQNLESRLGRSREALDEFGRDRPATGSEWQASSYEAPSRYGEPEFTHSTVSQQPTVPQQQPIAAADSQPSYPAQAHAQDLTHAPVPVQQPIAKAEPQSPHPSETHI